MEIQNFDKMTDKEIRDYIASESDPWLVNLEKHIIANREFYTKEEFSETVDLYFKLSEFLYKLKTSSNFTI